MIIFFCLIVVLNFYVVKSVPECINKLMVGNLQVSEETVYVAEFGGNTGGVIISKNISIEMKHGRRIYLADKCIDKFQSDMFKGFKLLGGSISFKVDLSKIGCACNAAFYMASMPGHDESGKPDPTPSGDYYCSANVKPPGQLCPEIDLMESNNRAIQITLHKCDTPTKDHYTKCDGHPGCTRKLYKLNPKSYGKGSDFLIDTNYPFQMNFSFVTNEKDQLIKLITVLTGYNGNTVKVEHNNQVCGSGYLESLSDVMKGGMVIIASNWGNSGSQMSWLDVPPNGPCSLSENCDMDSESFVISDFKVVK